MRKGFWSLQKGYRNCGKKYCQQGCADDVSIKPHGPYYELRRRNPETGHQDRVYLGKDGITKEELAKVNENYYGPDLPKKPDIFHLLGVVA
jgi:hypothetical protein